MNSYLEKIISSRPIWILTNDQEYQDIFAAIKFAKKGNNENAVLELEQMLEARKKQLLE